MSFEMIQEGGPLKAKKTGQDQYSMSVSIPKDKDGRLARECPNQECSPGYFKVTPGTGITGGQTVAYCPYCQKSEKPSGFKTKEQIRYAKELVMRETKIGIERAMKETLGLGLMPGKNDLQIHKMEVLTANGTMRTELKLPWELATRCTAWGSSLHRPSTTKRYSYWPARRLKRATHFPSPVFFSGVASGRQSLKLPATCTSLASGAENVRMDSCSSNAGNRSETGCMGGDGLLFPAGRACIALGLTAVVRVSSPILPKPAVKALVSRLTYDFFILTRLHWF
jgi:hypothetical protein